MSAPEHRHCPYSGQGSIPRWKQPSLYLGLPAEMFKSLSPPSQQYIPEDFYCWKHLEPRLLFCEDEQVTLCNKCFLSQEHKNHAVFGAQEAAELYKVSFLQPWGTPALGRRLLFVSLFIWGAANPILQDHSPGYCLSRNTGRVPCVDRQCQG